MYLVRARASALLPACLPAYVCVYVRACACVQRVRARVCVCICVRVHVLLLLLVRCVRSLFSLSFSARMSFPSVRFDLKHIS